jgi:hypothetical protein
VVDIDEDNCQCTGRQCRGKARCTGKRKKPGIWCGPCSRAITVEMKVEANVGS